eukprot:CAMPEP_0118641350 /NCGR_PEP_ID=MMETSP0785-20121206/5234_1 /TAXON_ID=91992 /ORGANISM="Bolidomonas pacifica, Strain CCMP 1866" /LENGTH=102 /DNA_ID=CAMNT_0006532787 /DNA_START=366 /DNA_END=674 /DNA_ORIENTATION=-
MSSADVPLDDVLLSIEESNALCNGHRMEISKLRFLHSEGRGGNSNPMYKPLYDEIIECPSREDSDAARKGQATIGAVRNIQRANLKDMFVEKLSLERAVTDG